MFKMLDFSDPKRTSSNVEYINTMINTYTAAGMVCTIDDLLATLPHITIPLINVMQYRLGYFNVKKVLESMQKSYLKNELDRNAFWLEIATCKRAQTFSIADNPKNAVMNRYRNIKSADGHGYELRTQFKESNYINATVYDFNGRKYIATQGPLKNTVSHFWMMVMENKSSSIVQLANWVEGGKAKVFKYLPEISPDGKCAPLLTDADDSGNRIRVMIKRRHRLGNPADNGSTSALLMSLLNVQLLSQGNWLRNY